MNPTDAPGASGLLRQAAQDLGHLLGQHVKVAQLELTQEMRAMLRHASVLAVLAALLVFGYGLAVAGLAVVIGGHPAVGIPLAIIGAAHVACAGMGWVFALARKRGLRHMQASSRAMDRSLEALKEANAPSAKGHHVS